MCLVCQWSKCLTYSRESSVTRRAIIQQAAGFSAMAVAAPLAMSSVFAANPTSGKRPSPADGKADWFFFGGTIYTVNEAQPTAQAVAVRGQEIVYVGDLEGGHDWRGPSTRVIDLKGRMLMPGFIDSHNHLVALAVTKLGLNLRDVVGKDKVLNTIRDWVAKQPANAPLRGHGWTGGVSFGSDHFPRREWLDEITGDRPMFIWNADMHESWFNTAAMKLAGLTKNTPDPEPGKQYFKRDADGTPTGIAIEGASMLVAQACGVFSRENIRESQKLTIDPAPSTGLTTYFDAGVLAGHHSRDTEMIWQDLIDRDNRGELPIRIVGSAWTRSEADDPKVIAAELVDWNKRLRSPHVQISCCKMWTDGTAMAGTALLLEPFENQPNNRGSITLSPAHIKAQIEAVHRAGFDMHIHADGDGSVRHVLDGIEAVQKQFGRQGRRHTVCHISLGHPDDVKRFEPMGVVANGTPLWATNYDGVYVKEYKKLFGAKRMEESVYPYGDLVRSGATVTFGADLGGVDLNEIAPLIQLEATVTRKRPGFPNDPPMVPRQRISVEQAIKAYTINGAYQLRLEDKIGSIEVGKLADLIVLGQSLFDVKPEEIHTVPVLLTLMDGKARHDRIAN